jgi:hypothetical protein
MMPIQKRIFDAKTIDFEAGDIISEGNGGACS